MKQSGVATVTTIPSEAWAFLTIMALLVLIVNLPTKLFSAEITDISPRRAPVENTRPSAKSGNDLIKAFHFSGTFTLPAQKVAGRIDVISQGSEKQWLKVEIPNHGKHLRVKNRNIMWHFDPPPESRTGEGLWSIYPRPGYAYAKTEIQRRLHEIFDFIQEPKLDERPGDHSRDKVVLRGRECSALKRSFGNSVLSLEYFDSSSKLPIAVSYPSDAPETFLLDAYKEFSSVTIPTLITRLSGDKTNDVFTIDSLTFTSVPDSLFTMPLHVRDWPENWNEFDEAYPPPTFVHTTWPWAGEHSRFFHTDFDKSDKPFYWSYVVLNALRGDTLKTADELRDALHRYDSALYGKSFPPEKIIITIKAEKTEIKVGHAVTVRSIQIDGFDPEATQKPLTTFLQVYRCTVLPRTVPQCWFYARRANSIPLMTFGRLCLAFGENQSATLPNHKQVGSSNCAASDYFHPVTALSLWRLKNAAWFVSFNQTATWKVKLSDIDLTDPPSLTNLIHLNE